MFERFSSASRRVMVQAQLEAASLGHDFIGTEHLLLAIANPEHAGLPAYEFLLGCGVEYEDVRSAVQDLIGPVDRELPMGNAPFTPRSKKVLELSLREALAAGRQTIEAEHVLLGILREGEGVAAK